MRVSVKADFVACVSNLFKLLRERLNTVCWGEPGCLLRSIRYCWRDSVIDELTILYLLNSLRSRSTPTVAPYTPRETLVGF